jgi:hypothetical protein
LPIIVPLWLSLPSAPIIVRARRLALAAFNCHPMPFGLAQGSMAGQADERTVRWILLATMQVYFKIRSNSPADSATSGNPSPRPALGWILALLL